MHIFSLRHTKKEDNLITLWRWRSHEFTFYTSKAGSYEPSGSRNNSSIIFIDQEMLDKLEKVASIDCFGETLNGIANNTKNRKILGVRYENNVLVRV